jgi:Flp pilus assembly protein TadG
MSLLATLNRFAPTKGGNLTIDLLVMAPLLVLAVVGFFIEDAMTRQAQLADAIRTGVQATVTGPPTEETLEDIAAAIRLAAPKNPSGSQSLSVELLCVQPSGATARCTDPAPGQAIQVAIRLTETWRPPIELPLLPRSLPLQAGLTLGFQ